MNSNYGVIFDLDGVLIDTGIYHKLAWRDFSKEFGLYMDDEFFIKTFGMQNYQIIPMLAGKEMPHNEIYRLSEWKESQFRKLAHGSIKLLDGVEDTVKKLKNEGFRLAIGSSTTRSNIDFFLDNMDNIRSCFDDYVVGEDVLRSKPAPDTFLKAAEKLNLPPIKCIVIEDAVAGVQAAKAAGMKVIAVTNSRKRDELFEADIIVDKLSELSVNDFKKLLQ